MNKRKLLTLAMTLCMVAILAIGGTLAYFSDSDAQTNVFTVGNVKIDLFEDFNSENLTLVPAVKDPTVEAPYAAYENTIEKEVYVENEGSEEAYVRVHIAIPALTRGGQNINAIDFVRDEFSTVEGKWNWGTTVDANFPPRDGGDWNMYRNVTIGGVPYKVFVATYETALNTNDVTVDAINKAFMDPDTTNDEITEWNRLYGDGWKKIYVVAEAAQADGFDNAFDALNAAFGVPGQYSVNFNAASEDDTFVERTSMDGN